MPRIGQYGLGSARGEGSVSRNVTPHEYYRNIPEIDDNKPQIDPDTGLILWNGQSDLHQFWIDASRNVQRQASVGNADRRRLLNKAYLRNLDDPDPNTNILFFQFMPDGISDTKRANWADTPIMGRSEPIKGYEGSSSRSISFEMVFAESVDAKDRKAYPAGGNIGEEMGPETESVGDPIFVKSCVAWCRSLVYPRYDTTGYVKPPPRILLRIGELIRARGVITDVSVSYGQTAWDPASLQPFIARVSLNFEEVNDVPFGHAQVRQFEDTYRGSEAEGSYSTDRWSKLS